MYVSAKGGQKQDIPINSMTIFIKSTAGGATTSSGFTQSTLQIYIYKSNNFIFNPNDYKGLFFASGSQDIAKTDYVITGTDAASFEITTTDINGYTYNIISNSSTFLYDTADEGTSKTFDIGIKLSDGSGSGKLTVTAIVGIKKDFTMTIVSGGDNSVYDSGTKVVTWYWGTSGATHPIVNLTLKDTDDADILPDITVSLISPFDRLVSFKLDVLNTTHKLFWADTFPDSEKLCDEVPSMTISANYYGKIVQETFTIQLFKPDLVFYAAPALDKSACFFNSIKSMSINMTEFAKTPAKAATFKLIEGDLVNMAITNEGIFTWNCADLTAEGNVAISLNYTDNIGRLGQVNFTVYGIVGPTLQGLNGQVLTANDNDGSTYKVYDFTTYFGYLSAANHSNFQYSFVQRPVLPKINLTFSTTPAFKVEFFFIYPENDFISKPFLVTLKMSNSHAATGIQSEILQTFTVDFRKSPQLFKWKLREGSSKKWQVQDFDYWITEFEGYTTPEVKCFHSKGNPSFTFYDATQGETKVLDKLVTNLTENNSLLSFKLNPSDFTDKTNQIKVDIRCMQVYVETGTDCTEDKLCISTTYNLTFKIRPRLETYSISVTNQRLAWRFIPILYPCDENDPNKTTIAITNTFTSLADNSIPLFLTPIIYRGKHMTEFHMKKNQAIAAGGTLSLNVKIGCESNYDVPARYIFKTEVFTVTFVAPTPIVFDQSLPKIAIIGTTWTHTVRITSSDPILYMSYEYYGDSIQQRPDMNIVFTNDTTTSAPIAEITWNIPENTDLNASPYYIHYTTMDILIWAYDDKGQREKFTFYVMPTYNFSMDAITTNPEFYTKQKGEFELPLFINKPTKGYKKDFWEISLTQLTPASPQDVPTQVMRTNRITYNYSTLAPDSERTYTYNVSVKDIQDPNGLNRIHHYFSLTIVVKENVFPSFTVPTEIQYATIATEFTFNLNPTDDQVGCTAAPVFEITRGPEEAKITNGVFSLKIDDWRLRDFGLNMKIQLTDCLGLSVSQEMSVLFVANIAHNVISPVTVDPAKFVAYQIPITSIHQYEDLDWKMTMTNITGFIIDDHGAIHYTPPDKYYFETTIIHVFAYDIQTGNITGNNISIEITFAFRNPQNLAPVVWTQGESSQTGVKSGDAANSTSLFKAYDPEGKALTYGIVVHNTSLIKDVSLDCRVTVGGQQIGTSNRYVDLYVCNMIWNPVSLVDSSGMLKIWFKDDQSVESKLNYFFYGLDAPTTIVISLSPSNNCPIDVTLRTQWKCQIVPQTSPSFPHSKMTIVLAVSSVEETNSGDCVTTNFMSYGKGYFEWLANSKGCNKVNLVFTITTVLPSNGRTVSSTLPWTITMTDTNYPPVVSQFPFIFTPDETSDHKYTYSFVIFDHEKDTVTLDGCTFDYHTIPEASNDGFKKMVVESFDMKTDGTNSTIVFAYDQAFSIPWSGEILCTISETVTTEKFTITFRFAVCLFLECRYNPILYKAQTDNSICTNAEYYTHTCDHQTDTGSHIVSLYGINMKSVTVYFGESVFVMGDPTVSGSLQRLQINAPNIGKYGIDIVLYNNCSRTSDIRCDRYSTVYKNYVRYKTYNRTYTFSNLDSFQTLRKNEEENWVRLSITNDKFSRRDRCIMTGLPNQKGFIYYFDLNGSPQYWCYFPEAVDFTFPSTNYTNSSLIVYDYDEPNYICEQCKNLLYFKSEFKIPERYRGHIDGGYIIKFHLWELASEVDPLLWETYTPPKIFLLWGNFYFELEIDTDTLEIALNVPPLNEKAFEKVTATVDDGEGGTSTVKRRVVDVKVAIGPNSFHYTSGVQFEYEFECSSGTFCLTNYPQDCPYGFYCPANPKHYGPPILCALGTFNSNFNSTECTNCTAGRLCNEPGLSKELPCPNGWLCNTTGLSFLGDANECPPQYYCVKKEGEEWVTEQFECISENYCEGRVMYNATVANNLHSPTPCFKGFSCTGKDMYVWGTGRCDPGNYCPVRSGGIVNQFDCSENDTIKSAACACPPCPINYYCNLTGISKAEFDTFCISNPTDASCPQICPPGHFCIEKSVDPTPCPLGQWQPEAKKSVCILCTLGYFCNSTGLFDISNLRCLPGFYCDKEGLQAANLLCPAGRYCLIGTDSINERETDPTRTPAQPCPLGHFCLLGTRKESYDPDDKKSPTPCQNGTYANITGLSVCLDSPGGYQCNGTGLINPQICPKGTFREGGSSFITCQKCEIGTYNEFEGRASYTDCLPCPAGTKCTAAGVGNLSDSNLVKPCDTKRYCPEGTSTKTINFYFCPAGFACPEGLKSIFEAYEYPCPRGRFCPEGSGDTKVNYAKCMNEWINDPALCPIGELCRRDFFCQLGTKDLSNSEDSDEKCPKDTNSNPGSYSLLQCQANEASFGSVSWNFVTEEVAVSNESSASTRFRTLQTDYTAFPIDPYSYREITINVSKFPVDPKPQTFRDFRIEFEICNQEFVVNGKNQYGGLHAACPTNFGTDFKNFLYINWQDDLAPVAQFSIPKTILNNKFQEILIQAQQILTARVNKTISELRRLPDLSSLPGITFKVYANTKIWLRFNFRIYNGFFTYKLLRTQFLNTIIVGPQITKIEYTFVARLESDVATDFEAPLNIFTPVNDFNPEVSASNIGPSFFPWALATVAPETIQSYYQLLGGSFKDSNYKFWGSTGYTSILTQYFPYTTDCDGYGSYITFSEFLTNPEYCYWPETQVPVLFYNPAQAPQGQMCNHTWTCRYPENLLSSPSVTKRFWMKSDTFSKRFIYFISKKIIKNTAFGASYLSASSLFGESEKMEIRSQIDQTDPKATLQSAFPSNVTLDIGYLQTPDETQEIVVNFMTFSGFREDNEFLNNPSYIFTVRFQPLSWKDNLDYFAFPSYIYYLTLFMITLFIFLFIFTLWYCYYKYSKVLPRPQLKILIYLSYTFKALSGIFLGGVPIVGGIILSYQIIVVILKGSFLEEIKGDYSLVGDESSDQIKDKGIGRFALAMFVIGIYSINKGISLLLPSENVGDPRNISREEFLSEVRKKKSLLFYSTFIAIAFGSIFNQISKSPVIVGIFLTVFVVIYGQVSGNIIASAKAGFNDDLMVLPMKGAFSLIQLMLSLKIGKFTDYVIGYLIKIVQKIIQTQLVMPNRIAIEDFVAKIKKARGLKSAQTMNLGMTRARRIYQEQLSDLGLNSMDYMSSFVYPILMGFQLTNSIDLNIKISTVFLTYFMVFTLIQATAEIFYNVFLNNGIEARTGRKLSALIEESKDIFDARKTLWCLSDKSPLSSVFFPAPHEAKSLQKMGFSSQFFFMTTIIILGMIWPIYSIELWINKNYNFFKDVGAGIIVAMAIIIAFVIEKTMIILGRLLGVWMVNKNYVPKETPEQKARKKYAHFDTMLRQIFDGMSDSLRRQERSIAINYLISEMMFRTFQYSPMEEQRLINMMDLMNYFEEYINRENLFEDLNGENNREMDIPLVRVRDKSKTKDKIRKYLESKKNNLTTKSGTTYELSVKWSYLEYTNFRSQKSADPMSTWKKPKFKVQVYKMSEEQRKKGKYVETIIKSFSTAGNEFDKQVEERKEKIEAEKRASMIKIPQDKEN